RVQAAAFERFAELEELDAAHGFGADQWRESLAGYFTEYEEIGVDADARSASLLTLDRSRSAEGVWDFRQVFQAPAGDHGCGIVGTLDLEASGEAGEAIVQVTRVGPLT